MPTSVIGASIMKSSGQRGTKQMHSTGPQTPDHSGVQNPTNCRRVRYDSADAVNIGYEVALLFVCRTILKSL
jgi:hypothetical protein